MKAAIPSMKDFAFDGHPCEAALEFRRAVVRFGVADELTADAVDLATCMAWLGKAISRTEALHAWLRSGTDPNTWQAVRVLASDFSLCRIALDAASNCPPKYGMEAELKAIRESRGYARAALEVQGIADGSFTQGAIMLAKAARALPGRVPHPQELEFRLCNIVDLSAARRSRKE